MLFRSQSVPLVSYKIRPVVAVASSSLGLAGVEAEMPLPDKAVADHLLYEPGFVRNCTCGRMSVFERE